MSRLGVFSGLERGSIRCLGFTIFVRLCIQDATDLACRFRFILSAAPCCKRM